MTYQTDFKKKLGNPNTTPSPDWQIRDWGCYLNDLAYIKTKLGIWLKSELSIDSLKNLYFTSYQKGWLDWDCTVLNPARIVGDKVKDVRHVPFGSYHWSSDVLAVVGRFRINDPDLLKNGQASHFVVLNEKKLDEVEFDPVKGGSRHVREGVLVDLRVFYSKKQGA